jgi:hypothetical protein
MLPVTAATEALISVRFFPLCFTSAPHPYQCISIQTLLHRSIELHRRLRMCKYAVTCVCVSWQGFGLDIGFIDHLYTRLGTTSNYGAIANLHNSLITAPAKPSPACCVFTSCSLVTASNSGDFFSFRAQVLSECRLPSNWLFSSQPPVQNWLGRPSCLSYNSKARTE